MESDSNNPPNSMGPEVGMSSEAILNRLDIAAQLLELCLFLGQAKLVGPVSAAVSKLPSTKDAKAG